MLLYFVLPMKKFSSAKIYWSVFAFLVLLNTAVIALFIYHVTNVSQGIVTGAPGYDKKFMIAFILNRFHWFMDFVFKTVYIWSVFLCQISCPAKYFPIPVV